MNDDNRSCRVPNARAAMLVLSVAVLSAAGGCGGRAESDTPVALRAAANDPALVTVAVDRLVRDQRAYAGRLGVQGVIVQSYPERGAFVLVDLAEFKSCGLNACTDAAMPVRFDAGAYEGALPPPGTSVTLIGDFAPDDRGFAFSLLEVQHEGGVILARKSGDPGV